MAATGKRNIGGIIFVSFLLLFGGCAGEKSVPVLSESVKEQKDVALVEQGDLRNVEYYSLTSVPETKEITIEHAAYVKEWKVSLGDEVKKDDVIAVLEYREQEREEVLIDGCTMDYELEQLRLDLELARNYYELLIRNKESKEEIRLQEIEIELLELKIKKRTGVMEEKMPEETEKAVTEAVIEVRAPFDGTVVYCTTAVDGELVPALSCVAAVAGKNTVLTGEYISEKNLSAIDRIYAVIDGIETELVKLPYSAEDFAQECARFEAQETEVAAGRTIGAYLVSDTRENVCYVPINALQADGDGYFLYVVTATEEDGAVKREKRKVEIGLLTMSFAEIVSGVQKGEKVLVTE